MGARFPFLIFFVTSMVASISLGHSKTPDITPACTNVRLDAPGGPLEKVPVYDQKKYAKDDSNICYAIAAAQLADVYRFYAGDKELKQLTSPISMALHQKNDPAAAEFLDVGDNILGRGEDGIALRSASGQLVCDQRWLEKIASLVNVSHRDGSALARRIRKNSVDRLMGAILEEVSLHRAVREKLAQSAQELEPMEGEDGCALGTEFFQTKVALGRLPVADLKNAIDAALEKNRPIEEAKAFLAEICKGHSFTLSIPQPNVLTIESEKSAQLLKKFIAASKDPSSNKKSLRAISREYSKASAKEKTAGVKNLSQKVQELLSGAQPLPVAVSIDGGLLLGTTEELFSTHSALIAGRRFNPKTKECEFLVRDSYGTNCKGAGKDFPYAFPCEAGGLWIPSQKLMNHTYGITWLPAPTDAR